MNEATIPALISTLVHGDPIIRRTAAEALGKIGNHMLPVLLRLLRDRYVLFSLEAIDVLATIGSPAVPELIEAMKHESTTVRCRAVVVLGKIGDTVALQALSKALQDPSPSVRWDAAFALRLQEDQLAIAVFLEVFKDREQRKEVFYANKQRVEQLHFTLWKIGSPVIPALLDALKDNDEAMQQASGRILRAIGSSDKLARKILAENSFTPKERILVLASLRQALASHFETDQGRRFPKTDVLCRQVLEEEDSAARAGAEAVLNAISLLRGSQADTDHYSEELVRPAEPGAFRAEPQSMLRAADQPQESREPLAPRRTIWQRLFEK